MADEKKNELAIPAGWSLPELSEEELKELNADFRPGVRRFVPKVCPGPSCSEINSCPLAARGIQLPVGRQCFVEVNVVRMHMRGMIEELGVKEEDVFDLNSIGQIAIHSIMIKRAAEVLSREDIVIDSFRGHTQEGDPIFERKANPAVAIIEKHDKRVHEISASLMATRKEKSKDEARKRISPTEVAQRLREKMAAARLGVEAGQRRLAEHYGEVVEADFTVEDSHGKEETTEEEQGSSVRGEAGPAIPKGRQEEAGSQEEGQVRRDPVTGFLIYGEEEE